MFYVFIETMTEALSLCFMDKSELLQSAIFVKTVDFIVFFSYHELYSRSASNIWYVFFEISRLLFVCAFLLEFSVVDTATS